MTKWQTVAGTIINVFLAGLGYIFAPKGKKMQGVLWFGAYLVGSLFIDIILPNITPPASIFWIFGINIWSAISFFNISRK